MLPCDSVGRGLWMSQWMRCLAGGRCWRTLAESEFDWGSNVLFPSHFLFALEWSLKSTEDERDLWRLGAVPFSACFNWGEEFGQNKTAHLVETEKKGTHPPGDCKCRVRQAGSFPSFPPGHGSHSPRRARGSYRQRGLSNPAFPQNFHLLSLTEREGLMIPWPFVGFLGGSINLDGCTNIYVPCLSLNGEQK